MKLKTIESGSKGNCSLLLTDKTKFIIDIGITYLKLKRSLEELKLVPNDFTGILITHSHTDHIRSLGTIIKHTKLDVYIPLKMYAELKEIVPKERVKVLEEKNQIEDLVINVLPTSHDTKCSVGYLFESNDKSIVYITDTGYINRKILNKINNKDVYLIESNHDIEMLMKGPYPDFLKERVKSDYGHLSNDTTARYLKKLIGKRTKYILLAHISEKNNTYEKILEEMKKNEIDKKVEIILAKQDEESPLVEV